MPLVVLISSYAPEQSSLQWYDQSKYSIVHYQMNGIAEAMSIDNDLLPFFCCHSIALYLQMTILTL